MESRAKVLGHPIHPMLIVFPLGLLTAAVIFDVLYLILDNPTFATVAFWNIAAGVIGGLIAAAAGLIDWLAIPQGTRAKTIGLWHGLGNAVALGLFAISWILRLGETSYAPGSLAFILALAGLGIASVTGWMGGELVDRLGVGVSPGANLDSPSSLSGKPADANLATSDRETAPSQRAARPPVEREREVGG